MKFSLRLCRLFFFLFLYLTGIQLHAEQLLLIASKNISITPLTGNEIKRLFLAAPVIHSGIKLSPVINRSDRLTYQVFLQAVMGRSAYTYEKQLLTRFYTSGVAKPLVVRSHKKLYEMLNVLPGAISFIMDRDFGENKQVQKIQILWKGEIQ